LANPSEALIGAIKPTSAHSPSLLWAQTTTSGPLAACAAGGETVGQFFGRLDADLEPEGVLKLLCDRLKGTASVGIHPEQKLAISPREQGRRGQAEGPLKTGTTVSC
jgi:hypothetical protein